MKARLTKPLITIRPDPVLHVWQDGQQVAAAHLTSSAALIIAADLLRAISISLGEQQGPTTKEDGA